MPRFAFLGIGALKLNRRASHYALESIHPCPTPI
jgi:hypothetical protein